MRYHWTASSESLQMQIWLTATPYFFEYLGSGNTIIMTPMTNRAFISMITALDQGKNLLIKLSPLHMYVYV